MEELDVSDAIQITQETLINICEYLENVRALAFSRCYNISRECYV